jgi:hypothetical protein
MRMTRRRIVQAGLGVALGLAAAGASHAACRTDPCLTASPVFDCDRDGLTDAEECNGLTTAGGAAFAFPSCRVQPTAQPECLDPLVSDLFVRLEKATNSAYTDTAAIGTALSDAEIFSPITQASGGLALRVHVLPASVVLPASPRNAITPRMAALTVREVRGAPGACPVTAALGAVNGVTSVGGAALAQVFTQRILDHVSCVYGTANANSPAAQADKRNMLKHTTAHEATHLNRLAPESVDRFGGHHYKTGSGCVMDQSSTYSTKGGVRFNTPLAYCGPDQSAVLAGETALGPIQCADPGDVLDQDAFTNVCLPATP